MCEDGQGELRLQFFGRGELAYPRCFGPFQPVTADAAFLTAGQLPAKRTKEGYLETIPKLVVEVKSKDDTWSEIESKVAEYLAAGVELV